MGRKLEWPEKFLAAFAGGTMARIDAVRLAAEDRRSFIRKAVDVELAQREAGKNAPKEA